MSKNSNPYLTKKYKVFITKRLQFYYKKMHRISKIVKNRVKGGGYNEKT